MKPKLVFVINSLEGGGAERVVSILSSHFSQKRYLVTVICFNKTHQAYPLSAGVNLIHLVERKDESSVFNRFSYAVLTFFNLLKVLLKEQPYCAVSFMTTINLWTGLACLFLKIPFIVSERTTPDHTINKYRHLLKWLAILVYKGSKAVVVPAKGMIHCFKKNKSFQSLDNFEIIHNPITRPEVSSSAPVHHRKFLLSVGRIDFPKGFDQLIDAYSRLDLRDTDLLISGEGSERENILNQIKELGLEERVKLIGFKKNLADYYSQAELFVLSSRREGYPNVLIEAMSYGCPSIAMDCEFGPSEIIKTGWNGVLVEKNNIAMLAEAISNVLNNPSLKEKFSRNGKLINDTNSLDVISAKWEKLIVGDG